MIQLLDHKYSAMAEKIRAVFQVSYAVEAKLLQAIDFPPLQRKLSSFTQCENVFFGFYIDHELAGIIELRKITNATHVQSLVVDPQYFRKGVAENLMQFVLEKYNTLLFSVETGIANFPAIQLYKKLGFIEISQCNTDHGIRKVRFEK